MHSNEQVIEKLYTSLSRRLSLPMAECYHPAARFHDIAFDLHGKPKIAAMWAMICGTTDIRTTFQVLSADDETAVAKLVDEYTFSQTGRRVHNVIESRFRFRDGLIVEHVDACDPRLWAAMAIGGIGGFLAGRIRLIRSWKANALLRTFERQHGRGVV